MKEIIYIDMDDTACDYREAWNAARNRCPEMAYPQCQYGFYTGLKEKKGFYKFWNLMDSKYDLWFLTAPSIKNPLSYTEKRVWVGDHGYPPEKLIICPNKGLLRGEYLIDDNKTGKGQDQFQGRLIHFGSEEFPNWKSITDFFETKYKNGY